MADYFNALAASEHNPVKTRSVGAMDATSGLTTVLQQRGKTLFHLGFHAQQRLHLYPEEAWCLAHRGVLDLSLQDDRTKLLSLRDVCDLVDEHVPRPCREAYCFLRDHKFFPRRHKGVAPQVSAADVVHVAFDVFGNKKTLAPLFRVVVFEWDVPMPHASVLADAIDEIPLKVLVVDAEGGVLSFEVGDRDRIY
ncbi:hypothetical protein ACHHYP_10037 [Achlya hypogyna]|uniref:tRNA-splicing endonuclease subunit Sen54 N-terminal domain-containing protein n=1 Tax=Achlya hypogyna TaxID=1202772 RepID=A0A1V9ZIH5_ACHHY|nr:hypothetical protein ACHHYP_10037 [Achlya hypogyna]